VAITEAFANSQAVDTTEWSMPRDASYTSASPQTDDGIYQIVLDVSDMVALDELQIRVYEKVNSGGTQRIVYEATLLGAQNSCWVSPSLILMHGWDATLDAIVGTITVIWSIRKVA